MTADDALARAIEAERPALVKFARLQLGGTDQVEDLVQETLLAALEMGERFQRTSSLRTWLIGILKHKIVDTLRKAHRSVGSEEIAIEEEWFDASGHWRREYAPARIEWRDPASEVEERQLLGVLERCLERLSASSARVFMLRELHGLESNEICGTLEISESNLHVLLYRARSSLRACLETHWFKAHGVPLR